MQRSNTVSLRPATAFGASPRMRLDLLVNDFCWRATKDRAIVIFEAAYKRTLIHVRDLARAFLHTIEHFEQIRGEIYNVGSVTVTKQTLCEEIDRQLKENNPEDPGFIFSLIPTGRDPDQRNYVVSDEKIRATGYTPIIDLSYGVRELLMLYRTLSDRRYSNV